MNWVAYALSQQISLLTTISTRMTGFDTFRDLYAEDPSFRKFFMEVTKGKHSDFILQNDFLFHRLQSCVPDCSSREHIIQELHGEGHFG